VRSASIAFWPRFFALRAFVRERLALLVEPFALGLLTVVADLFEGVVAAILGTARHSEPHRTAISQFRIVEPPRILSCLPKGSGETACTYVP
jgi:hypothetical protein